MYYLISQTECRAFLSSRKDSNLCETCYLLLMPLSFLNFSYTFLPQTNATAENSLWNHSARNRNHHSVRSTFSISTVTFTFLSSIPLLWPHKHNFLTFHFEYPTVLVPISWANSRLAKRFLRLTQVCEPFLFQFQSVSMRIVAFNLVVPKFLIHKFQSTPILILLLHFIFDAPQISSKSQTFNFAIQILHSIFSMLYHQSYK